MVLASANFLDLHQFRWIETQTNDADRRALLSIKEAVCRRVGHYFYLEVGSHLGGSLQPHLIDSRCHGSFSIDPRPQTQPDERTLSGFRYEGNSTQRMIGLLSAIPGADLSKLHTFDLCSWEIPAGAIPHVIDFAFIDGEHVDRTVMRDFHSVSRFLSPSGIVAFHDSFVVSRAILGIQRELIKKGMRHQFYYYPGSSVVAVTLDPETFTHFLSDLGWEVKMPLSYWQGVKTKLDKYFPSALSFARRIKRRFSRAA